MRSVLKPLCLGWMASTLFVGTAVAADIGTAVTTAVQAMETATAAAVATPVLTTEEAQKLISDKGYICMSCHQVETKMVGPSYKEVGERYQDADDEMKARLASEIIKGKMADLSWGAVPMPPNPTVTEEDSVALVAWALSLGAKAK
jgi:cytochrome c